MTKDHDEPRQESTQRLQEFVDSRGADVRIDPASSVLSGVKLLGLASRNGRRYREAALRRAIPLYEGAKVNINHPQDGPLAPRDYRDRIGVIRAVRLRSGEGLFGSLHFNPKHPLAEQLAWDAEHAPENVGFSHNVLARTVREGEGVVVEAIERVQSVDLVADPATTGGLFEAAAPPNPPPEKDDAGGAVAEWDRLTIAELKLHRPDLLAEIEERQQTHAAATHRQIERLTASEAAAVRRQRITELLVEHGLPLPGGNNAGAARITSETFLETLRGAPDEDAVVRLIADRAQVVDEAARRRTAVVAREQSLTAAASGAPPRDATEFVSAVTARSK